MNIRDHLRSRTGDECQSALAKLLGAYLNPAFGTLPKREIDLIFYGVLKDLGLVDENPSVYSLIQRLRVTRQKARGLLYEVELRRSDAADLDSRVRAALKTPVMLKHGSLFSLEIENPLELDHVRSIIRELGHASDGSFSPNLVKLSPSAFGALTEHFLTENERNDLKAVLVKAGFAADTTLRAMLTAVLKKIGSNVAADVGDALADKVSDLIGPFVDGAVDKAFEVTAALFKTKQ